VTLDIRPPEGWPPAAQRLYHEFEAQVGQRLQKPRNYLRLLYRFFPRQHEQGLGFRDFPQAFLDAYLAPLKPLLRREYVDALKAWLRFLYVRKELLLPLHLDMAQYLVPVHSRRRVLLNHQQVLQVLELPPTDEPEGLRDRAILEMAYASGMRRGELANLDLTDIDPSLGLVSIRRAKNSCQRTVPLTYWARHYLQRYLQEARPQLLSPLSLNALWLRPTGRRLHQDGLGQRLLHVYQVREKLGFAFTLHQLRHACATHLLSSGASVREVQELLGHLKINSTQTYTHITPAHLQRVHLRCHPRNNGEFDQAGAN
jgi:site-specific recombinase XerD